MLIVSSWPVPVGLQSMNIVPRCAAWASSLTSDSGALLGGGGDEEAAEQLALKLSKLLCALAEEVMEALKRVENGGWLVTGIFCGVEIISWWVLWHCTMWVRAGRWGSGMQRKKGDGTLSAPFRGGHTCAM